MRAPVSIKDLISALSEKWKPDDKALAAMAIDQWDDLVGHPISVNAIPFRFKQKTLWIAVTGSVWAQELEMRKQELMNRLNEFAGKQVFTAIRFQVKPSLFTEKKQKKPAVTPLKEIHATDPEAMRAANSAEYDEMKDSFTRMIQASINRDVWFKNKGYSECVTCGLYYLPEEPNCPRCRAKSKHV